MKNLSCIALLLFVVLPAYAQSVPLCRQNRITAVFPPKPTSRDYAAFNQYVLANDSVWGVTLLVPWNTIEKTQGVYSFDSLDNALQFYMNPPYNKVVNLIIAPAAEGGIDLFTPAYVWGTAWATTVGAGHPQDYVYNVGNFGAEGIGTCRDTFLNVNSSPFVCGAHTYTFDPTGQPVPWEAPINVAYKKLIDTVIRHFKIGGTDGSGYTIPQIGYIRFGLVAGGEIRPLYPSVNGWPNYTTLTNFVDTVEVYDSVMMVYEDSVMSHTPGSGITELMADIDGFDMTNAPADYEAHAAVSLGRMGFCNNGLTVSDSLDFPNTEGDWGNMFVKYMDSVINDSFTTLSLQLLYNSDPTCVGTVCPTGSNKVGSLVDILPLIAGRNSGVAIANNYESYYCDLMLAYDPYYDTSTCPQMDCSVCPTYTSHQADYYNAFALYLQRTSVMASISGAPLCAGGVVTLSATITNTITSTYFYTWSGAGISGSTAASPTGTPTASGTATYSVGVSATNGGCIAATGMATVAVSALPVATVTATTDTICYGSLDTLIPGYAYGTGSVVGYYWSGSGGFTDTTTTGALIVSPPINTTYSVTVTTGGAGCVGTAEGTVSVWVGCPDAVPQIGVPDNAMVWDVYLNPASGIANVSIAPDAPCTVVLRLIDITGKTWKTATAELHSSQTIAIDVTGLPPGNYTMLLVRGDELYDTKKVVIYD